MPLLLLGKEFQTDVLSRGLVVVVIVGKKLESKTAGVALWEHRLFFEVGLGGVDDDSRLRDLREFPDMGAQTGILFGRIRSGVIPIIATGDPAQFVVYLLGRVTFLGITMNGVKQKRHYNKKCKPHLLILAANPIQERSRFPAFPGNISGIDEISEILELKSQNLLL